MFLSGDSYLSKAYADDFQDSYRDNYDYQDEYQEDYQDRDSWDYYDWKRYWENNNRANETEDNNNTTENQGIKETFHKKRLI